MKELTCTDAIILKELLKDGRKSFTQIANELGQTKAAICKRFKEMEKSGIIVGSTIQLDYARLGYNAVGTIEFKADPENIDDLVNTISEIPNTYTVIKSNNRTDVTVVVEKLKDIEEFNKLKEFIKGRRTVSEVVTYIWMGTRNIPENLKLVEGDGFSLEKNASTFSRSSHDKIDIDDIDEQIIEKLARDGRTPFADIAKELGIATNTVIRKYERLKQNGVIKVIIQVNPEKMGYRAFVMFYLAFLSQSSLSLIVDKLSAIPDISSIIKTSGQYDLVVFSLVKDIDHIISLREEIHKIAEITKEKMFLAKPTPIMPGYKEYISTF